MKIKPSYFLYQFKTAAKLYWVLLERHISQLPAAKSCVSIPENMHQAQALKRVSFKEHKKLGFEAQYHASGWLGQDGKNALGGSRQVKQCDLKGSDQRKKSEMNDSRHYRQQEIAASGHGKQPDIGQAAHGKENKKKSASPDKQPDMIGSVHGKKLKKAGPLGLLRLTDEVMFHMNQRQSPTILIHDLPDFIINAPDPDIALIHANIDCMWGVVRNLPKGFLVLSLHPSLPLTRPGISLIPGGIPEVSRLESLGAAPHSPQELVGDTWKISVNHDLQASEKFPVAHAACLVVTRVVMFLKQNPDCVFCTDWGVYQYMVVLDHAMGTVMAMEMLGRSFCLAAFRHLSKLKNLSTRKQMLGLTRLHPLWGGELLLHTSLKDALIDVMEIISVPSLDSRQVVPSLDSRQVVPSLDSRQVVPSLDSRQVVPSLDSRQVVPSPTSDPQALVNIQCENTHPPSADSRPLNRQQIHEGQAFVELRKLLRGDVLSHHMVSWSAPELQARFHRVLRSSSSLWPGGALLCVPEVPSTQRPSNQGIRDVMAEPPVTSWHQHSWAPAELLAAALAVTKLVCCCSVGNLAQQQQQQHCPLVLQSACTGWRLKGVGQVSRGGDDVLNGKPQGSSLAGLLAEEHPVQSQCSCKSRLMRDIQKTALLYLPEFSLSQLCLLLMVLRSEIQEPLKAASLTLLREKELEVPDWVLSVLAHEVFSLDLWLLKTLEQRLHLDKNVNKQDSTMAQEISPMSRSTLASKVAELIKFQLHRMHGADRPVSNSVLSDMREAVRQLRKLSPSLGLPDVTDLLSEVAIHSCQPLTSISSKHLSLAKKTQPALEVQGDNPAGMQLVWKMKLEVAQLLLLQLQKLLSKGSIIQSKVTGEELVSLAAFLLAWSKSDLPKDMVVYEQSNVKMRHLSMTALLDYLLVNLKQRTNIHPSHLGACLFRLAMMESCQDYRLTDLQHHLQSQLPDFPPSESASLLQTLVNGGAVQREVGRATAPASISSGRLSHSSRLIHAKMLTTAISVVAKGADLLSLEEASDCVVHLVKLGYFGEACSLGASFDSGDLNPRSVYESLCKRLMRGAGTEQKNLCTELEFEKLVQLTDAVTKAGYGEHPIVNYLSTALSFQLQQCAPQEAINQIDS